MSGKCKRCNKQSDSLSDKLWDKGPNGYRKYKLCPKCCAAVDAESKPAGKKVPF